MTKTKSTKRALLLSALSLLMCVSMLIGSTFAWFTDSVTSAGNKIKAGNLDIELHMFNGTDYVDISNSVNPIFGDENSLSAQNVNADTLWEPGKTQVAYLKIKNSGSLALKYTVALDVKNVSKDLYKVMKYDIVENATNAAPVTAWNGGNSVVEGVQLVSNNVSLDADGEHYFALAIHMDESAGNEYQNGQVNFDLTILATQETAEEDSFNNQYDVDAYNTYVYTAEQIKDALAQGGNIALANDIIISESLPITKDTVLDLNGKNIGTSGSTTGCPLYLKGGKLTVKNGTLDLDGSETNVHGTFATAIGYEGQTELVVENVTFTGQTAINGTFAINGPLTITVSNSTINATNVGIAVAGESTEAIATVNNCNINAGKYAIFASQGAKITINGGTYKSAENVITSMSEGSVVTVNGGSFEGNLSITNNGALVVKGGTFSVNPSAYVADGYDIINNANGTYTVVKGKVVANAAELENSLANAKAGTTIYLAPANYGTLVFNQNADSKVVDITTAGGDAAGNEHYSKYENITIIGTPGAIVDQINFNVGWIAGSGASFIDIKNLTIKDVTFSGAKSAIWLDGAKGSHLGIDGLTIENCKMADDGNDRFVFQQITGYKQLNDKTTGEYVMTAGIKNLTITGCEVEGAYQVIESRAMENLTITNNTFKGIKERDMLITYDTTNHPGVTYTGTITITGNTSINGEERFIRGAGIGNATLIIKDNTINNYKGADDNYIKVEGATGTKDVSGNVATPADASRTLTIVY